MRRGIGPIFLSQGMLHTVEGMQNAVHTRAGIKVAPVIGPLRGSSQIRQRSMMDFNNIAILLVLAVVLTILSRALFIPPNILDLFSSPLVNLGCLAFVGYLARRNHMFMGRCSAQRYRGG